MGLQFISDSKGETTGVFIPINEWNELKSKFKGIEEEEDLATIPDWHINIIQSRLDEYKKHPERVLDFDTAMDEIDKEL